MTHERMCLIMQNTLYTGPNPPSPILLEISKWFVAALICLKVNKPVWMSKLSNSVNWSNRKIKKLLNKENYTWTLSIDNPFSFFLVSLQLSFNKIKLVSGSIKWYTKKSMSSYLLDNTTWASLFCITWIILGLANFLW